MRRCVHEFDVVTFTGVATGFDPFGDAVTIPAGTTGTVVREHSGTPWIEVEVGSDDGTPLAFVEIERDQVLMKHPLVRSAR